ncbi:MAG: hypothetical protein IKZ53_08105 [Selenomonadaceae bacterium]|nr:hypothetical protein [Selenomonadaceae bacterium]
MKNAAIVLATLAIIIFTAGEVDAADFKIDSDKNFVEQRRSSIPMKIPRRFLEPPREIYRKRQPVRPTPHYYPKDKPKPFRNIRGGSRGHFRPPLPPFR